MTLTKAKKVATIKPKGLFKKGKNYSLFATAKVTNPRGNALPVGNEPVATFKR